MASYEMRPIGVVRASRTDAVDDQWDSVTARIELDPEVVDADATAGLDTFSHVEVVFVFDRVDPDAVCRGARHPRSRTDWPSVGILAQRAKDRPNRIGVTVCRLIGVTADTIELHGLDAVDGSPVLDVKPWMVGFGPRGVVAEPAWATDLMSSYW